MSASARAALALGGLLFAAALPRPGPPPEPCPEPAELRGRGGHSVQVACGGGPPLRGPARRLYGLRLDPNRADPRSLETLPRIGPVRARAIAEERRRRPFARLDDLLRVPGIGPRTLEAIAGQLAIDSASDDEAPR